MSGVDSEGKLWLELSLDMFANLEKDGKHVQSLMDADDEIKSSQATSLKVLRSIRKIADPTVRRATEILILFLILKTYDEDEDALQLLEVCCSAMD